MCSSASYCFPSTVCSLPCPAHEPQWACICHTWRDLHEFWIPIGIEWVLDLHWKWMSFGSPLEVNFTLNCPGMAPPVRLLPSAGSITSQDAPVFFTDSPEPWIIQNGRHLESFLYPPKLSYISIFGLQGWEGFRYGRCTVNVWRMSNCRAYHVKIRVKIFGRILNFECNCILMGDWRGPSATGKSFFQRAGPWQWHLVI